MSNVESRQAWRPEDPAEANEGLGNQAAYDEYLRWFDRIPVLQDTVSVPVRPPPPPDFRRGERPNARREARPDSYTAREANLAELERLYDEYLNPSPAAPGKRKKSRTPKTKSKTKRKKSKARTMASALDGGG
jgi:hypothetical protein